MRSWSMLTYARTYLTYADVCSYLSYGRNIQWGASRRTYLEPHATPAYVSIRQHTPAYVSGCDQEPHATPSAIFLSWQKKKKCVLIVLYTNPHTSILCVLILLDVSWYLYICVLMLLYMCPHTTICMSSYCYTCAHTTIYVSWYYYICFLILLYMCPHTTPVVLGAGKGAGKARLKARECSMRTHI